MTANVWQGKLRKEKYVLVEEAFECRRRDSREQCCFWWSENDRVGEARKSLLVHAEGRP